MIYNFDSWRIECNGYKYESTTNQFNQKDVNVLGSERGKVGVEIGYPVLISHNKTIDRGNFDESRHSRPDK